MIKPAYGATLQPPFFTEEKWVSPYFFAPDVQSEISPPTKVLIHDVTLRDGEQAPRIAFTPDEKLLIARALDRLGVRSIEPAFRPLKRTVYVIKTLTGMGLKAKIVPLCRVKPEDVKACLDLRPDGVLIFDYVTEDMSCGREEIFGPVLCIKRVDTFEEGLAIMNASRFANGSVIFTESGHFAREFAKRTDGGMVGINVGIPVPLGIFGFTGHKRSFFGDLHCMGRDAFTFFTETKNVTSTWFTGKEAPAKVSTWDGTMTRG